MKTLWIGGSLLLWLLYSVVFFETTSDDVALGALEALANVLPLTGLAIVVRSILRLHVMPRTSPVQIAWHVALSTLFATTWYAVVLVFLALVKGGFGRGFAVSGFSGSAFTWQVFQGLILYAAIAAICYAVQGGREAAQVTMVSPAKTSPRLERYLIRRGEEMTPVEVSDIVTISGAQDYAEVSTSRQGRHLVRLSLSEFEARLDPDMFVRVHRSSIIHFRQLIKTEPAGGGRLLAYMQNGDVVQVSRAGAQELRRFLV